MPDKSSSSTLVSVAGPVDIKSEDGPTSDAFGRLRVAQPHTLFDSKLLYDAAPLLWDDQEVSGAGTTSTYEADTVSDVLAVAASTTGLRVRQTFRRMNYQPGKCQQIIMTGNLCNTGGGAGIKSAFGIFDANDGIFLQYNEGVIECILRSSTSGSPVDRVATQADWNLDKMDGTGHSGARLDFTKAQLIVIDYAWLGVGRVRMGAVIKGQQIYFHEFNNSNVLVQAYMATPDLTLRYQVSNDGTGQASSMRHMCCTVISEGGRSPSGVLRWESTAGAAITTDAENIIFALIGIRLKADHLSAEILLKRIGVSIQTTAEQAEWLLIFNPTVADTFTYANVTNSALQVAKGGTANRVTNGTIITGGYLETGQNVTGGDNISEELKNAMLLGSSIAGVVDTIVLCVRPIGGVAAMDVEGGIGWRESV